MHNENYMNVCTTYIHVPACCCMSRELWRAEATVDQSLQDARDELTKYERNLRGTMGKVIMHCVHVWYTIIIMFMVIIILLLVRVYLQGFYHSWYIHSLST